MSKTKVDECEKEYCGIIKILYDAICKSNTQVLDMYIREYKDKSIEGLLVEEHIEKLIVKHYLKDQEIDKHVIRKYISKYFNLRTLTVKLYKTNLYTHIRFCELLLILDKKTLVEIFNNQMFEDNIQDEALIYSIINENAEVGKYIIDNIKINDEGKSYGFISSYTQLLYKNIVPDSLYMMEYPAIAIFLDYYTKLSQDFIGGRNYNEKIEETICILEKKKITIRNKNAKHINSNFGLRILKDMGNDNDETYEIIANAMEKYYRRRKNIVEKSLDKSLINDVIELVIQLL